MTEADSTAGPGTAPDHTSVNPNSPRANVVSTDSASTAPTEAPSIEVRSLSFRYTGGPWVLREVSFAVARGEILGIVGPSGAGKSTLLHHLNGLLPDPLPPGQSADNSPVRIEQQPLCKATLREVRRNVGLLFQDPDDQLFCPTVAEDVAFGPLNLGLHRDEARQRVEESLRTVGLEGFGARSTLQLSIGERKRVCLAGVLACRPRILALDEPFSNLDPRARRQLLEALKRFEGSIVIATHQLDLVVQHCDRVIVLDGGQLIAAGPPAVILSDPVLMERHGLEVPLTLRIPPESRPS
ncbi:MAG: ABC transporter ATP-binding protein [Planctomycetaceae bacterium]|nr:ABC transporter ATP-binding protein [Planctomycetaceae bacterium]